MFDPTKPVRTRDGRPVRILTTDAPGIFPIIAAVRSYRSSKEEEVAQTYTAAGRYLFAIGDDTPHDLVNFEPPQVGERYGRVCATYLTEESARGITPGAWDVVRIVTQDGKPVSAELLPQGA